MAKRRHAPQREAIDLQTPFHKLPGDLLLTTARKLGEFGLHAELADAIRRPESEAIVRRYLRDLDEALLSQRAEARSEREAVKRQRPRFIRGMFTPPEQQVATIRQWGATRLEIWKDVPINGWLAKLGPAPAWPSGRLQCVVLDLALPDQPETTDAEGNTIPAVTGYIRTVRDLWGIISGQHPNHWKYEQLHLDAEHLFLLDGATYEPGLRWRVLDLGANWDKVNGIAPATVRDPKTSPNTDGFAALAHHPKFVRRMNDEKVPYLWIAGFQVTVPGNDPRRDVPIVHFNRAERQVHLNADWDDHPNSNCSVPARLGV